MSPDEYPNLSPRDVGRLLGLNAETVRRMARRGELACFMVRGRMRFRRADVDALAFGQPLRIAREAQEPRQRRVNRPPGAGSLAALEELEREAEG